MTDQKPPDTSAERTARHKARAYKGEHIKPEPDGRGVVAYDSKLDEVMDRIAALETEQPDVTVPKPRFDSTISWGNILVLAAMLLGFAGAWGTYTADMAKRDARIDALQTQVIDNKRFVDDRAAHYIPDIERAKQQNDIQENRLQNFADSLKSLRDMLADVIKTMQEQTKQNSEMHEAVTVLRMQLERLNPPGPRGG